jgi:hypothetical protein
MSNYYFVKHLPVFLKITLSNSYFYIIFLKSQIQTDYKL